MIHTGDSPIGWMEKARWKQVQDIMLQQKTLDKEIDVDKAYTPRFLEKIYNKS